VRNDFDVCENCETKSKHPYPFVKIVDPSHAPSVLIYEVQDVNQSTRPQHHHPHHHHPHHPSTSQRLVTTPNKLKKKRKKKKKLPDSVSRPVNNVEFTDPKLVKNVIVGSNAVDVEKSLQSGNCLTFLIKSSNLCDDFNILIF
jgi:hypothetical protein